MAAALASLALGLALARPTAAGTAAAAAAASTAPMWRELEAHCDSGMCALADGSRLSAPSNTTDCKGRLLAYEYGLKLLPSRKPQLESFDALQLEATCGVTRPRAMPPVAPPLAVADGLTFVVSPGESIVAAVYVASLALQTPLLFVLPSLSGGVPALPHSALARGRRAI